MRRSGQRTISDLYIIRAAAPTVNDDETTGIQIGQRWIDTSASPHEEYVCVNNADGAALWENTTSAVTGLVESSGPTTLALGAWADGKLLRRSGSTAVGSVYPTNYVVRSALQSKTALATPSADNTLLFAVAANEVHEFELNVLVTTDGTVDGLKIAFSAPSGVSSVLYSAQYIPKAAAEAAGTTLHMVGTGDSPAITVTASETGALLIKGIVTNGSTAGSVTFKWSQGVSNAGALIVAAKSYLKSTRIS